MSFKRASQTSFWGLVSMGLVSMGALLSAPMIAQANQADNAPLKQPSAFEAVDKLGGTDTYWSDISFADDAKNIFVIDRDEARIERRSKHVEMVYQELLKQQTEGHAIMRTQDIPNLFETSLQEMQK